MEAVSDLPSNYPELLVKRFVDIVFSLCVIVCGFPFFAPSSNLPEQLLMPRPQPQIRIVDTILNPTIEAASDAPSTAADPHRRHHP